MPPLTLNMVDTHVCLSSSLKDISYLTLTHLLYSEAFDLEQHDVQAFIAVGKHEEIPLSLVDMTQDTKSSSSRWHFI
jgi:hypothetical protein